MSENMFPFREPLKSNPSSKVRINGDFAFTPLERGVVALTCNTNLVLKMYS
jgi:hypothetical protein